MSSRILLVEDEPDARASLARTLRRESYICEEADSVAAALAVHNSGVFLDAIVTDLVLGDDHLGGIHVLQGLRGANVRAPVVVITAFADVEKVKLALNEGASYLLEKPFRSADLLEILTRCISEHGDLSHRIDRVLQQANLTDKEASVTRLLLKGLTSAEIARVLGNSEKTIRQHISHVYAKCGVTTRSELFHSIFPS